MTPTRRHALLLVLITAAVRVPWLWWSPGAAYDLLSYAKVAACPGPGLYRSVETAGCYPYLPLWWLILRVVAALQSWLGGSFGVWSRLPALVGDAAVSVLVYSLVERRSRSRAALAGAVDLGRSARAGFLAGLGWALNPVAILVSAAHGQFDSLPLALLLGAAWCLEYSSEARAELWAALCLSAAVALKTWPLAFLPFYLGAFSSWRERLGFLAWVLLPALLLLAPWAAMDGLDALAARLGYAGATALGAGGALRAVFFALDAPVELYRQADDLWRAVALVSLALAYGWALWNCRRLRLLEGLPWAALALLALAPGLSPQYLGWPIALALAVSPAWAWRWTLLTLPLLLLFYGLFFPALIGGAHAWAPPHLGGPWILAWALLNLGWWIVLIIEWNRLAPSALMPAGRRHA